MNITDHNLIAEIEATCPPPILPLTLFSPAEILDPHLPDAQLFAENMNEIIDQDVNRPNQRAFWNFDFELKNWDMAGRVDPLPHMPHVGCFRGYAGIDKKKAEDWWKEVTEKQGQDHDHSSFVIDLGPLSVPVIESAALPSRVDFTANPVGAAMPYPGYFASTPLGAMLPNGSRLAEKRSPTGWVEHVVAPPNPFLVTGFDYWIVSPPAGV